MLKLKDNVDLGYLRKFGFEDLYISKKYKVCLWNRGNSCLIQIKIDTDNILHFAGVTNNIIDIIYEMISENLIEKVDSCEKK